MALTDQLDRLAAFEPSPFPVISLYLDTRPNQHGRDYYHGFIRKEFKGRSSTYPAGTSERQSLDRDVERISRYLESNVDPSANAVAIFACDAAELFEAVQLDAPLEDHWLYIGDSPHLYPLARLQSQFPRYAAVLADTQSTRILVVAEGAVQNATAVKGVKTRRQSQGGWSQARYQRHIENYHVQHVKEVVDTLERIVQREGIDTILLAGDPVVTPLLRDQMPKQLADKVVDEIKVSDGAADDEIVRVSLDAMRRQNERTDREKVDAAIGAYRAGGLGVVGADETLLALTNGQVDELLLTASLQNLAGLKGTRAAQMALANDAGLAEPAVEPIAAGEAAHAEPGTVRLADELVTKAQQTAAKITFIEDAALLEPFGGVAATLRYRI